MTIDEAIAHCLEVAEQNDAQAEKWREEGGEEWGKTTTCRECAADHRQLAEWLMELKDLRNSIGAVKLKDMKDAVKLLSDLDKENTQLVHQLTETKWLLKAAVEDLNATVAEVYNGGVICASCKWINDEECCCPDDGGCDTDYRWRYTDEALKLIE